MFSYSQIGYQKLILRIHTSKEIPKKELNKKNREIRYKGVVTKVKHQVCYIRIIRIVNGREYIEEEKEIRLPLVVLSG